MFNFNAGPALLPRSVMSDYQNLLYSTPYPGVSWLELGHRTACFQSIVSQLELALRDLLAIPDNYCIFFPPFGGRAVSSLVAMNLIERSSEGAAYIDTGLWSQLAFLEAQHQGAAQEVVSAKSTGYHVIPSMPPSLVESSYSYVHTVDNETAHGLRYHETPSLSAPIVSDMTSSLLTQPLNIQEYGVVYAAAQKNLSSAGLSVVIVRQDLIGKAKSSTPSMFDFESYRQDPTPVTPDMMAMVLALSIVRWHLDQGGIDVFFKRHLAWSKAIYEVIDQSSVFYAPVDELYRSHNNIVFFPHEASHDFVAHSESDGLLGLAGHRTVGGLRASLYNAMTEEGVEHLINWIKAYG